MSDLNAFLDKAKGDEELKTKLMEAGSSADVVALGKEAGFNFTEEDLNAHHNSKISSGEVSQEDLDRVSGGFGPPGTVLYSFSYCP